MRAPWRCRALLLFGLTATATALLVTAVFLSRTSRCAVVSTGARQAMVVSAKIRNGPRRFAAAIQPRSVDDSSVVAASAATALASEDLDEAAAAAQRCLAARPSDLDCHHALVAAFTRRGLDDDAVPAADRCLAVDPDDRWCLAALALVDLRAGAVDEAAVVTAQLERDAPASIETLVLVASVARARGDIDAACRNFALACDQGQPYACAQMRGECAR